MVDVVSYSAVISACEKGGLGAFAITLRSSYKHVRAATWALLSSGTSHRAVLCSASGYTLTAASRSLHVPPLKVIQAALYALSIGFKGPAREWLRLRFTARIAMEAVMVMEVAPGLTAISTKAFTVRNVTLATHAPRFIVLVAGLYWGFGKTRRLRQVVPPSLRVRRQHGPGAAVHAPATAVSRRG